MMKPSEARPARILMPDDRLSREVDWGALPVDVAYYSAHDPEPYLGDRAQILVVGLHSSPAAEVLAEQLPALELVQVLWAGVEEWEARLRPSVQLVNARGAYGLVTAELATGALIAFLRGLPTIVADTSKKVWRPFLGESVWRRPVLVVGAGDVGQNVARQLRAFDAHVRMVARTARAGVHATVELPDLLRSAEVVVIATPLTRETMGMVDAEFLARMPDGAVLVNVGRGPVVVTDDLVPELTAGRLRAVLDVTDPEPLPPNHPLWGLPNVLITPHVGGGVQAGAPVALRIAVEQIGQYLRGERPENLIDRP